MLAIAGFGAGAGIRRKAVVAGVASVDRVVVMGGSADLDRGLAAARASEEFRFQAREGFTVIEQGNSSGSNAPRRSRWS